LRRWVRSHWAHLTETIGGIGVTVLAVTGIGLAVYVVLFMRAMLRQLTLEHLIALLNLWQTQTGATFAIAAALIGAVAILRQTPATKGASAERAR
jgi:hypothetical protein